MPTEDLVVNQVAELDGQSLVDLLRLWLGNRVVGHSAVTLAGITCVLTIVVRIKPRSPAALRHAGETGRQSSSQRSGHSSGAYVVLVVDSGPGASRSRMLKRARSVIPSAAATPAPPPSLSMTHTACSTTAPSERRSWADNTICPPVVTTSSTMRR